MVKHQVLHSCRLGILPIPGVELTSCIVAEKKHQHMIVRHVKRNQYEVHTILVEKSKRRKLQNA